MNALMRWINVSTPVEVAVDFYGGVLGCDVIRVPHPATADEPTQRTARSRYSWVPLVSIGDESVSSAGARLPGARSSRLIHSGTGPPVALVLNGDDDVWPLAADMPGATIVGDTRAVAGGLRVMELTPAVARLFGDVFGEHFVPTVEAHETSTARDPLVFVAAKALAPDADSSWIPVFRVGDIATAFSEAIAHGATVGAAPTAAPRAAPMTASLRDPFGAPFLLVHGAVTSWESLDATHHIISLTRARFDDSDAP